MMVFVYKIPMLSSTKRSLYCDRQKIYVYLEMFAFDRASIRIFIAFSNNESLRLKSHTLPPCNCISFLYYFQQTMLILDTHQLQELTIIYLRWTYCFIICNIHWISFYSRPQISISLSNVQKKILAMSINAIIVPHAIGILLALCIIPMLNLTQQNGLQSTGYYIQTLVV